MKRSLLSLSTMYGCPDQERRLYWAWSNSEHDKPGDDFFRVVVGDHTVPMIRKSCLAAVVFNEGTAARDLRAWGYTVFVLPPKDIEAFDAVAASIARTPSKSMLLAEVKPRLPKS